MATPFFGVPYIAADQAQKHVTHNEAMDMLAAMAGASVVSATDPSPAAPAEGAAWIVPPGGAFVTPEGASLAPGDVAVYLGGGWFGGPAPTGHRLLVLDEGAHRVHVGGGVWAPGSVAGASGSSLGLAIRDGALDLAGASAAAAGLIPPRAIVLGVTCWVLEEVTGAASYDLGDGSDPSRFGGALGTSLGAANVGVVGPFATYAPADVVATANGGTFTGGRLGLSVSLIIPAAP
ncbi:DUF2793 domain-containing protein [Oceanicella actignis]|uniref:DUF2793 domain-containing protein n=1 Tax=Oceanicella actignis TaxID=1189325 RepID=A0A1M7U1M8_9RHOB|nr:DUF2793 domain-containing protein [Oceanicella actignis]SES77066.1 Protein of unknown function [Oceanicella actignis]SHN76848.1 Protein of unknown function [Oceanicella actignis]